MSYFQIMEMQDLGTKLRMVVMAHRRISIVKKAEETIEAGTLDPQHEVGKNGFTAELKLIFFSFSYNFRFLLQLLLQSQKLYEREFSS